jgi:UDP:flavonoid glycosyltransferase YjiC (YdhE family)
LANEPFQVILTTGYHSLPEAYLPLPENFYHASYVPGLSMAEKCDLMIHHGGYGSCQTGLYAGTPSVMIPTFSERESNARKIAMLGAGEYILPRTHEDKEKSIDLQEFRAVIGRVLNTPSYTGKAKHYREKLRAYGGPEKAAQLIADFAEDHR